jgi:signal transduction histidine kinase
VDDVATDDLMREVAERTLRAGVAAVLSVPMMHRGRLLGVVVFMRGSDGPVGFSPWECRIAESIAGIGAVCMESADLYGLMQQSVGDVDALNITLRQTVEELRGTQDRLVESERLAAVGGVSASLAHSLRNPLAAIRAMAQADLEKGGRENLNDIIKMVDRLGSHMNQILEFCKTGNEVHVPVDPNGTIESVIEMVRAQAEGRQVAVIPKLASDLPSLSANPQRFERAVLSVIENAIEACEPGCRVEIVTEREGVDGVCIEVRDEGPGIPEEVLTRIFEPFFSTKASGTGLGTTIARTVIEALSGTVDVDCAPGGGTLFRMRIPGTGA